MRRELRRTLVALCLFTALACGSTDAPARTEHFDPDVRSWRGGCFMAAPAGKIINATPASEICPFGDDCSAPPGPGGLVYLDRFDPVSGDGDVTVLSSAAGATPVVVAPHGGGGSIVIGSTGARFDDTGTRLLTLANLNFVTGDLVEAPLPAGAPVRTLAQRVRVDNYDYTSDGGVLYVGNYNPQDRVGDLYYAANGTSELIVSKASRFDFVMYRLAPDRSRVASLVIWSEAKGGDLVVQTLPPSGAPQTIAHNVYRMTWSHDGHLVFRTVNPDRVTYALWSWDGVGAPLQLAPEVQSASVLADDVLFTTGWSVLEQRASLHMTPVVGGSDFLAGTGPADLQITATRPAGTGGVIAFFVVPAVTKATDGELRVTRFSSFAPRSLDAQVTISGGVGVSPGTGFVSYAIGFEAPQAPGSANPQPGIARELKVASVDTGASFVLATDASTFTAWDPQERFVAAIGSFAPAVNRGTLVVRRLADGAPVLQVSDVGNAQFGFSDDGSFFWAIQHWDDALRRGELIVVPLTGAGAWQPQIVAPNVAWVGPASAGRAMYGALGDGRDGIWMAVVQ